MKNNSCSGKIYPFTIKGSDIGLYVVKYARHYANCEQYLAKGVKLCTI